MKINAAGPRTESKGSQQARSVQQPKTLDSMPLLLLLYLLNASSLLSPLRQLFSFPYSFFLTRSSAHLNQTANSLPNTNPQIQLYERNN